MHAYGDVDLATLFRRFGEVVDIQLTGVKGNAATCVFDSSEAASAAASAFRGSETMRVSVVGAQASAAPAIFAAPPAPTATPASSGIDRESLSAFNARRAAERDRVMREMEEGGGEDSSGGGSHSMSIGAGDTPMTSFNYAPPPPMSEGGLSALEKEVFALMGESASLKEGD